MNYIINPVLLFASLFILFSCNSKSSHLEDKSAKDTTAKVELKEIELNTLFSGEPALYKSPSGALFLSYIEYQTDSTSSLHYAKFENNKWTEKGCLEERADYFVNWADFPQISSFDDQGDNMALAYLQYHDEQGHAYDLSVNTSKQDFYLHTDGKAAEHGFVSLLPIQNTDKVFAAWLDGRNAEVLDHDDGHGHGHGGAMSLRTAEFDLNGQLSEEAELDEMVCDCCQTDAAFTNLGPVIVYRDRSEEEIRDIAIVRKVDGAWTKPALVHNDDWFIAGCPVNGPAVAAQGNEVAVAWINGKNGLDPIIQVARSSDGGEHFEKPIRVDGGKAAGRVNIVALPNGDFLAIWMEYTDTRAALYGRRLSEEKAFQIMEYDATRLGGFPAIELLNENQVLIAWTQVNADDTKVATAIMDF